MCVCVKTMGDCLTGSISQRVNIGVLRTQLTDEHSVMDSSLQRNDHHQRANPFRKECGSLDSSCSSPDEEMLSPELDLTRNESFRQTIQRSHFAYQWNDRFLLRFDGDDGCGAFNSGHSLEGVPTELKDCANSIQVRNPGSFTQDNCYDSKMFQYGFPEKNSENSDTERDSSVLNNNVWISTQVSNGVTRTSNICHSNGAKLNYCDDLPPLIGARTKTSQPNQEGIMSLAFPSVKMSWEAVVCDTSSDESLADFQDSFQCNYFSLVSKGSEAIHVQEEQKHLNSNESLSPIITCDSKTATSLPKPPSILKHNEDQNNPSNYPPLVSEREPRNKKERCRVSFNIPEFPNAGLHYMQQAAQGGSGKLPFNLVVQEEEEEDDDGDFVGTVISLSPVQSRDVFQVSDNCCSRSVQDNSVEPLRDILSIFDGPNGYKQYYAAFLCCAQDDLEHFGRSFHSMLEEWGFRIFLPPRDLVLTGCNFDNMSRALEERCNSKILVVISVNYEASEECSFLTSFAKILDPDSRKRNIIPVQIDRGVELANVLKGLSIIHYNQDYKCRWLKQKLVDAIAA